MKKTIITIIIMLFLSACGGRADDPIAPPEPPDQDFVPTETQPNRKGEDVLEDVLENEIVSDNAGDMSIVKGEDVLEGVLENEIVSDNAGDMSIVIVGWELTEGNDFSGPPPEGKDFLLVDVAITNQGNQGKTISTLVQMELVDSAGNIYMPDSTANMAADNDIDGAVAPGETVRGQVGFTVPQEAVSSGLIFRFFPNSLSSENSAKFALDKTPTTIAYSIPDEMISPGSASVGDVVEAGGMQVIINDILYPVGNDANQPEPGYKFVVLNVTFKNVSNESQFLSSRAQTYLKNGMGQRYNTDITANTAAYAAYKDEMNTDTPRGDIAPGETVQGLLSYQIPEGEDIVIFSYESPDGREKVFVTLP